MPRGSCHSHGAAGRSLRGVGHGPNHGGRRALSRGWQEHRGEDFASYVDSESVRATPETNVILYVSCH